MMKRGSLLIGLLIGIVVSLLSIIVLAELGIESLSPSGITWLSANSSYEFASSLLEIRLTTPNSRLLQANLTLVGGTVGEVLNPSSCQSNSTFITCSEDFDILSLNGTSSEVLSDTDYTWQILAIDNDSGLVSKTLQFKVLNDAAAPRFVLNTPLNRTIIPNGSRTFTLTPTEEESGLSQARLFFDYYSTIATSSATNSLSLSCGSSCNAATVLDAPPGQEYLGFYMNITDRAGNYNLTPYFWLFVDEQQPEVNLQLPADGLLTNNASQLFFWSFHDNSFSSVGAGFTPQANCSLLLDGGVANSSFFNSSQGAHQLQNFTGLLSGLAEGSHTWSLRCTDDAGWTTNNGTRSVTLDRIGPVITLLSPANNSIVANGTLINVSISDSPAGVLNAGQSLNEGVNSTLAAPSSINISTSGWPEGVSSLVISSNDTLNNPSAAGFTFTVDVQAPSIQLLAPANTAYGNGTFFFNSSDDWGSSLSCSLLLNGSVENSGTAAAGQQSVLSVSSSLSEGDHLWQIRCTDSVGNVNISASRIVRRDTVAPGIQLISPLNSQGYNLSNHNSNGSSDFLYLLTENNPETCQLLVNDSLKSLVSAPANFTSVSLSLSASNSPYTWSLLCNDTAGNTQASASSYVYYDTSAPSISSLTSSDITSGSANVSWTTDETANHTIYYHLNKTALQENLDNGNKAVGAVGTSPRISLTGLSASSTYFYVAVSCDQFGQCRNTSVQLEGSNSSNWTTPAVPDSGGSGGGAGGGGGGGGSNTATSTLTSSEITGTTDDIADCNDGEDNDGDGLADLADPGCDSQNDGSESNPSTCAVDWRCTEWSACNEKQQARTCEDLNSCGTEEGKPAESQACGDGTETGGETAGAGEAGGPPFGVGQAIGLFNQAKAHPLGAVSALGVLALLGLAGWQRGAVMSGIRRIRNYRRAKLHRDEEEVRQQLRQQGLIK